MGKPYPVLIGVIIVFFVGGPLIAFTIARARNHTDAWFKAHGERIIATVTAVFRVRTFYHVAAKWDDPRTHKHYYFESNGAPDRPAYKSGDPFPVLIDPAHPKHYQMFLDPEEEKHHSETSEGASEKRQVNPQ